MTLMDYKSKTDFRSRQKHNSKNMFRCQKVDVIVAAHVEKIDIWKASIPKCK